MSLLPKAYAVQKYGVGRGELVGSLYQHKKPPAGIQCFGPQERLRICNQWKGENLRKDCYYQERDGGQEQWKSLWMLNSAISYPFLLTLTLLLKYLLGFCTLIISWEDIHHFSYEKEIKTQIMEKNVIEDSASNLKAIKFIFLKGLEASKIRESKSKGD